MSTDRFREWMKAPSSEEFDAWWGTLTQAQQEWTLKTAKAEFKSLIDIGLLYGPPSHAECARLLGWLA